MEKNTASNYHANTLVYAPAFHQLGGFSTAFSGAGGEDLDFGIRLRELGRLVFAPMLPFLTNLMRTSKILNVGSSDTVGGIDWLEQKHKLPSLRPKPFLPKNPEFNDLAELQIESLCRGYDQAKLENTMRFPARSLKRVALKILKG